jgi:hypothetical protein
LEGRSKEGLYKQQKESGTKATKTERKSMKTIGESEGDEGDK